MDNAFFLISLFLSLAFEMDQRPAHPNNYKTKHENFEMVSCALKDTAGNLWFGTNFRGLYRYDGTTFTHFDDQNGFIKKEIHDLLQDKSGTIWVATEDGPYRFDGTKFSRFAIPVDSARGIRKTPDGFLDNYRSSRTSCLLEDSSGAIWFGTMTHGVYRYDGVSFSNFLIDEWVICMEKDKAGHLWFGSQKAGGLYRYDGTTFTNLIPKDGPYLDKWIRCIVSDTNGDLWVGCRKGGIFRYDGTNFHAFLENDGKCQGSDPIFQDRAGNVWFGGCGRGVQRYDGKTFTEFTAKKGLGTDRVRCLVEDNDGNIWFGGQEGSLTRFDGRTFVNFSDKIHE